MRVGRGRQHKGSLADGWPSRWGGPRRDRPPRATQRPGRTSRQPLESPPRLRRRCSPRLLTKAELRTTEPKQRAAVVGAGLGCRERLRRGKQPGAAGSAPSPLASGRRPRWSPCDPVRVAQRDAVEKVHSTRAECSGFKGSPADPPGHAPATDGFDLADKCLVEREGDLAAVGPHHDADPRRPPDRLPDGRARRRV